MKKQPHTAATVLSALRMTGPYAYECKSCDPKADAQKNLSGRTHYVEDGSLRYFNSRIVTAYCTDDGLLFGLVESVNGRPDHGGYTKRFVVFDIWGTVISDSRDQWFRTSKQAHAAMWEFLNSFDAVKHTRDKAREKATSAIASGKAILAALR